MDLPGFLTALRDRAPPLQCANPYSVFHPGIDAWDGASTVRLQQLGHYLSSRRDQARIVLVAEAPGFQGARFSGIPMTSERILLGHHPRVASGAVLPAHIRARRTSAPEACRNPRETSGGFAEPTSTIVWQALLEHGLAGQTVLWNVFPFHPHKPRAPLTNRTPGPSEIRPHLDILETFLALFPPAQTIAVGRTAQIWLSEIGRVAPMLRHPANGGAAAFRAGLGHTLG